MRGRLPSAKKKLDASKPKLAPVSAATSSSMISASIAPLGLPTATTGSIESSRPAAGSVVGLPSRSKAQPSGIDWPAFAAAISLPRATSDSDRSISSGSALWRGKTAAIGSVPKIGCFPPAAGIAAGELEKPSPTMPAAATGRR